MKLVPLSLAEHAISWEVFRGRGRVPPLVVEFSERAGGDVDVLRKPLILNPAGTEGHILINVRGNLSVVNCRRLKAELVGAPIVANGRTVVRLFEPTAEEGQSLRAVLAYPT